MSAESSDLTAISKRITSKTEPTAATRVKRSANCRRSTRTVNPTDFKPVMTAVRLSYKLRFVCHHE